ncbi:hypothetical protein FKB36_03285 [Methanoculleus sp. Afa-1]|uniref:Uncharacterized protein n=1 Tax=Methanoculleus formosensis TaxID=2590886 RepID=A0A9E4ZJD3_9EURY|nr:hypothetical protein [Methanoculleus sp. Afa-1]
MRGSDRRTGITCPPDDNGDGTRAPCPFCGCRRYIEDAVAVDPEVHTPHQCLRCGRWFDGKRPVCPRCGSPGECIGVVNAAERGIYTQYRCCECSHGFMVRTDGGEDARRS